MITNKGKNEKVSTRHTNNKYQDTKR